MLLIKIMIYIAVISAILVIALALSGGNRP